MSISNNELGDLYTIRILSKVCEDWPVPIKELSCEEITGVISKHEHHPHTWVDSNIQRPKEWDLCIHLLDWLETEGVIRKEGTGYDYHIVKNVQITKDTLSSFRKLPDPLNPDSGNSLFDVMVSGAKTASSTTVSTITTAILGAIASHFS